MLAFSRQHIAPQGASLTRILWKKFHVEVSGKRWTDAPNTPQVSVEDVVCSTQDLASQSLSFDSVQVFVKTFSGKTITLDVKRCDTVAVAKSKIAKKTAVPTT